jgi:hypothetical protein
MKSESGRSESSAITEHWMVDSVRVILKDPDWQLKTTVHLYHNIWYLVQNSMNFPFSSLVVRENWEDGNKSTKTTTMEIEAGRSRFVGISKTHSNSLPNRDRLRKFRSSASGWVADQPMPAFNFLQFFRLKSNIIAASSWVYQRSLSEICRCGFRLMWRNHIKEGIHHFTVVHEITFCMKLLSGQKSDTFCLHAYLGE